LTAGAILKLPYSISIACIRSLYWCFNLFELQEHEKAPIPNLIVSRVPHYKHSSNAQFNFTTPRFQLRVSNLSAFANSQATFNSTPADIMWQLKLLIQSQVKTSHAFNWHIQLNRIFNLSVSDFWLASLHTGLLIQL
jgi:hypothetical protein